VRNQFVENQLTWDKLRTLQANIMGKGLFEEKPVEPWESPDIERAVGGFAAHAGVNDFGVKTTHAFGGVMIGHNCCTGNAGRTLYWIWDSILTREGDSVKVNLLLNRASPWLDIASHLPYEGKVALKIKDAPEVEIRIPEWTQREEVTCVVNGKERGYAWRGNYIHVVGLKPGDTVTAQFPMRERTLFKVIGEIPYTLTVKGNTVVDIESNIRLSSGPEVEISKEFLHPRADSMLKEEYAPLYQRDHYKADKAPMKKRTRFVSREAIRW
jgi:hypothetical protein